MEMTLWEIAGEIRRLVELREDLAIAIPDPGEEAALLQSREQVETELREYFTKEIRKVDGIRNWWRHCETMASTAKAEAKVQSERAAAWTARLDHLKAMCCSVMEGMPWPAKGSKKLEGHTGSLLLKGNGGKQAVLVSDPTMVPVEFCILSVNIPGSIICAVIESFPGLKITANRIPCLEMIRQELEKECANCGGHGKAWADPMESCPNCGGSGKQGVPGCQLAERGNHVECK